MGIMRNDGTSIVIETSLEHRNDTLFIVFSGFGYTIAHPLLHYSKCVAKELLCDYIGVDYDYVRNPGFLSLLGKEQDAYFETDTALVREYILDKSGKYAHLVLVGKSMGTSIINRLLDTEEIIKKSTIVLMTPGTEWDAIIKKIIRIKNSVLVVGSKNDKHYMIEGLEAIYKKDTIEVLEIEDGNHALETGIVENDIEIIKRVITTLKSFVVRQINLPAGLH